MLAQLLLPPPLSHHCREVCHIFSSGDAHTSKYDLSMWGHTLPAGSELNCAQRRVLCDSDALSSNTHNIPLSTCLSVHFSHLGLSFIQTGMCDMRISRQGVCDVPAELQCEDQRRTRWWKKQPRCHFHSCTLHHLPAPDWTCPPFSHLYRVCGDHMCSTVSVSDCKAAPLIRLHLGFVFFTKNIPGRAHVNPLES